MCGFQPAGHQWLLRGCLAGRRMRLPILGTGSLLQGFPRGSLVYILGANPGKRQLVPVEAWQNKIQQWSLPGATVVPVLNVSSRVFWRTRRQSPLGQLYCATGRHPVRCFHRNALLHGRALQVNGSRSLLCCRAVKMQMTGLTSCCRKRTYGPPLQLGELSQRRFPNRPFARSGAGCRPSISGWRSSCVGTCWLTGCTQRPRLGSHVNNFMQCFLTRLPGAATRIPMKKKPIVDLDLQRSRHGGSNGILQGSKCTWSS